MSKSTNQLESQFHEAMLGIYESAANLAPPYLATRFRGMVLELGGKETADVLLSTPDVSEGFTQLFMRGNRLDLSVEYLVLKNPWRQLFSAEQLRVAETRLTQYNFPSPEDVDKADGDGKEASLPIGEANYAVITENDISEWSDEPGVRYHFPRTYANFLPKGTKIIYYKGRLQDRQFIQSRLSNEPHYFAFAEIGDITPDSNSNKGDLFATIEHYQRLSRPVLARHGQSYLEPIPESRKTNYWRNGVRPISEETYSVIRSAAELPLLDDVNDLQQGQPASLESSVEGNPKRRFVTHYERDPALRTAAIAIHGVECCICEFNFGKCYGEPGEGFIHIHHLRPISEFGGETLVSPKNDMAAVCANCHAVIHRRRDKTISVEELRSIVQQRRGTSAEPKPTRR